MVLPWIEPCTCGCSKKTVSRSTLITDMVNFLESVNILDSIYASMLLQTGYMVPQNVFVNRSLTKAIDRRALTYIFLYARA